MPAGGSDSMRGKFITFEGGEGAGKSTQAKRLAAALETHGHRVVLTREPGGSPGAEEIRKLLVEGAPDRWTVLTETLLFLAARADHVARVILPALEQGRWVVSDRFSDSTLAYQGVARGLGFETVHELQAIALDGFAPDLTLVLDIDAAAGLTRAHGRANNGETRFERFGKDFHQRLRAGFLDIAARAPDRCAVIEAGRAADAVAADVWRIVRERLIP